MTRKTEKESSDEERMKASKEGRTHEVRTEGGKRKKGRREGKGREEKDMKDKRQAGGGKC
jgi:hypothetical protein